MTPDEANPWLTIASERVYDNPWITVREDRVVRPDGEPGIYGVVHYKNTAVGVLPVEEDHVYLVGQYRYPLERYSWEIPEGGCPEDEEPLEAARRELSEDTGLEAGNWRGMGDAGPCAEALAASSGADAIVLCPSNLLGSVCPILAIPGMREALAPSR